MRLSSRQGRNGLVLVAIAAASLALVLDLRSPKSTIRDSDSWQALVALNNHVHRLGVENGILRCDLCTRRGKRDERGLFRRWLPARR